MPSPLVHNPNPLNPNPNPNLKFLLAILTNLLFFRLIYQWPIKSNIFPNKTMDK